MAKSILSDKDARILITHIRVLKDSTLEKMELHKEHWANLMKIKNIEKLEQGMHDSLKKIADIFNQENKRGKKS